MREVIPSKLWIGNALDAREVSSVLGMGITAVIDLAIEEPPIQFPRDITNCRFPLLDGSGNNPAILRAAIETTATLIASGTPTLVTCGAGMSRSPAIVAGAVTRIEGITLAEALVKTVAQQPHDVSPSLLGEISEILFPTDRGPQP